MNEWYEFNLEEVCLKITDGAHNSPPTVSTGLPMASVKDLTSFGINIENCRLISIENFEKLCKQGCQPLARDVLIAKDGATALDTVCEIKTNINVVLLSSIAILRPDESKIYSSFLKYYLLSPINKSFIKNSFISGAAIPRVVLKDFKRIKIKIPSVPTQQKIAAILSAYDDLIENNTRRIRILEEMAQALYREWFVHFRFPGHESARMVESPLGLIPEGWGVKKLGDLAKEIRRNVDPTIVEPDYPYFGLEHLPRKSIALSEWGMAKDVTSTKLQFYKGEILFGKIRPYFHKVGIAPIDGVCSSDIIVISPKDKAFFPLVLLVISSDEFIAQATQTSQGTKMPRANWDVLLKYPIFFPPFQELNLFNNHILRVLKLINNLVHKNRNLRQQRDLLLPRLVSGELDVENSDIALNSAEG